MLQITDASQPPAKHNTVPHWLSNDNTTTAPEAPGHFETPPNPHTDRHQIQPHTTLNLRIAINVKYRWARSQLSGDETCNQRVKFYRVSAVRMLTEHSTIDRHSRQPTFLVTEHNCCFTTHSSASRSCCFRSLWSCSALTRILVLPDTCVRYLGVHTRLEVVLSNMILLLDASRKLRKRTGITVCTEYMLPTLQLMFRVQRVCLVPPLFE